MDQFLQQLIQMMQGSDWQGMFGDYTGQNAPTPPDYSDVIGNLGDMSGVLDQLFSPEQKYDLLRSLRQTGTQDITNSTGAANRAVGAFGAQSGMYGGAPMQSQIAQNYGRQAGQFGQLEAGVQNTGMQYDQSLMNSILASAGIQGNIANLYNQDFQNQFAVSNYQSNAFPNALGAWGQAQGVQQAWGGGGYR